MGIPCGRSESSPTLGLIVMMLQCRAQLCPFTRFPFMSGKVPENGRFARSILNKSAPEGTSNQHYLGVAPGEPQNGSRRSRRDSKMPKRAPEGQPGDPQSAPRDPQEAPKRRPEAPKRRPEAQETPKRPPRSAQRPASAPEEAPGLAKKTPRQFKGTSRQSKRAATDPRDIHPTSPATKKRRFPFLSGQVCHFGGLLEARDVAGSQPVQPVTLGAYRLQCPTAGPRRAVRMSRRGGKAVTNLSRQAVDADVRASREWVAGTRLTTTLLVIAALWFPLLQGLLSSRTRT